MKLTDEQIKRFWEWCGFQKIENPTADLGWVYSAPDKNYLSLKGYPKIDLDHLGLIFKYAVIKLEVNLRLQTLQQWVTKICADYTLDPALALFWAIYEVIEEETET